ASTAYTLGSMGQSGASGVASGLGGVARGAGSAAVSPLKRAAGRAAESVKSNFSEGVKGGFSATGGSSTLGTVGGADAANDDSFAANPAASRDGAPDWARRMKRSQHVSHGVSAAAHAVRSGDSHGGGSSVNLSESDRS
ncbi:P-type conjugative transfer protein TrbL, partial [Rhizobium sp. P44RR-XXIV]